MSAPKHEAKAASHKQSRMTKEGYTEASKEQFE
jgi:hypothetical protein